MRRGWRVGALVVTTLALAACDRGGASSPTLPPISSGGVVAATTGSVPTSVGATGAGFVSVSVRVAATGIAETVELDRSSVPEAQRDPLSLDAFCTPLDGGDGYRVVVTDLRRLGTGARLVSAALTVEGTSPGDHDGTLEVGDAQQMTTAYSGAVTIDAGGSSGSFDLTDASGGTATGTFVCADDPVVATTTTMASGGGEEVPGDSSPPPTAPPVLTVPIATVPEATS